MIITEEYSIREDGVALERTYSSENMMIRQDGTGILYEDAIDPVGSGRTYTETDVPIEEEEISNEIAG